MIQIAGGKGARLKVTQRTLDNFGYIKYHFGIQNDELQMARLMAQLKLVTSTAKVKRCTIQQEEDTVEQNEKKTKDNDPVAAKKYLEGGKLTKK